MIEAVIKQDLEELHNHLEALREKYGSDFHFFGEYGIEGDEDEDGKTPIFGAFAVMGRDILIRNAIHNILDKEIGVDYIMNALRCHCQHHLPAPTRFTSDLRDKVLELIQVELTKHARDSEVECEVNNFLDSIGFNH